MFAQLPKPTLFAHRGASAYAPENTLAAFTLAIHQNADAIELDAKLSADGEVVVIHDQTVDRTTDGIGKVNELVLAALKELDAGEKYDESYKGERIPTLDEVLESIGQKTFINIELTNYASPKDDLPLKVAEIVSRHHLENRVLCSSFNPFNLRRVNKIAPEIPLGLLASPGIAGLWARSFLGRWFSYQALHPEVKDTHPSLIQSCHRRGHRVHTYTVNHIETMEFLFNWNIDGIFTDDPPLALRVLSKFQKENPEIP